MYWVPILFLICLLILLSIFSAAETALTSVPYALVNEKSKQGNKRATIILKLLKDKALLIITMLTLSTFVDIFFTIYATSFTVEYLGKEYLAPIGLATAICILIFGEIIPKTYAFNNPTHIALRVAPLLYMCIWLLRPITEVLMLIDSLVARIKPAHKDEEREQEAIDTLRGAIDLFHRAKATDAALQEKEMLHSLLDLNNIFLSEIMVHRKNVFCLDINTPPDQVITKVINSDHTKIPIYENSPDNIVGILHTKTLLKEYFKSGSKFNIQSSVKKPVYFPETSTAFDLLMHLQNSKDDIVIIVDEYGGFMGILCMSDILEEVVGELKVSQINHIQADPQGGYIVSGEITIRDLNRKLKWSLPDDHATTLAGLILYETGRIPNVGNVFALHNVRLEVLEKKKQQIKKIKISKMSRHANLRKT